LTATTVPSCNQPEPGFRQNPLPGSFNNAAPLLELGFEHTVLYSVIPLKGENIWHTKAFHSWNFSGDTTHKKPVCKPLQKLVGHEDLYVLIVNTTMDIGYLSVAQFNAL
jgi:hypothetical protein